MGHCKQAVCLPEQTEKGDPGKLSPEDLRKLIHELRMHQTELETQNDELRRTQAELEGARAKYSDLYDFAPVGYFTFDRKGMILEVNLAGAFMLQMERILLKKRPFYIFIHRDDQEAFFLHFHQVLKTKTLRRCEVRLKRSDGTEFYAHLECLPVKDSKGDVILVRTVISDITERRKTENALILAMEEWEQTFDTIPDLVVVIDKHYRIKRANKALAVKLGVNRKDIIGKLCYKELHGTDEPPAYCPHVKVIEKGKENIAEVYENKLQDHYIVSSTPIFDSEGNVTEVVKVFREISIRKKMEDQLKAAAITDGLTGLYNRRGFITLADQHCKLADRTKRKVSLLYLDMDNMKSINDKLGHKAGDEALCNTAGILKKTFRKSDIIARLGGDEFVVLLTDSPKNDIENSISRHVRNNIRKFNEQSGLSYNLSLSMGFAHSDPEHPCSMEDLLTRADALMYEDKKGKSGKEVLPVSCAETTENRRHKRFETGDKYWAEIGVSDKVTIKDISGGGICLRNKHPLTAGKFHSMRLSCADEKIPVKTVLVRTRLTNAEDYEIGLKFNGLTARYKQSLEKIIADLSL